MKSTRVSTILLNQMDIASRIHCDARCIYIAARAMFIDALSGFDQKTGIPILGPSILRPSFDGAPVGWPMRARRLLMAPTPALAVVCWK